MAWPTTMTGLPREDGIWKPLDYKQNVQKIEGPSEKLSFNGEQFEFFKPKNQKIPVIV